MRPVAVLVDEIDDGAGTVITIGNDIAVGLQCGHHNDDLRGRSRRSESFGNCAWRR